MSGEVYSVVADGCKHSNRSESRQGLSTRRSSPEQPRVALPKLLSEEGKKKDGMTSRWPAGRQRSRVRRPRPHGPYNKEGWSDEGCSSFERPRALYKYASGGYSSAGQSIAFARRLLPPFSGAFMIVSKFMACGAQNFEVIEIVIFSISIYVMDLKHWFR